MKNLIIVGHPNKESFCYSGIYRTIEKTLIENGEEVEVIDLYTDQFIHLGNTTDVERYKRLVSETNRIYFVSPVWWFRTTPLMEAFFDNVFTPGFAYKFKPITRTYGYPVPLLKDKKVRTYLTHGAPALPVLTVYVNSVRLRLEMGVYSFVFGWFRTKTRQFWSVPFVTEARRKKYLDRVSKDVISDIKKSK